MRKVIPLMPRTSLSIQYLEVDHQKRKRIYYADDYKDALRFVELFGWWGGIHPEGNRYRIEI